jgi:hypothetical protein
MASVRFAAGGLLALGSVMTAGAGCRHAPEPEAVIFPIKFDGPECRAGGPSVDILRADRYSCGKGDTCTRVHMRLRNPEDRALFLLTDGTSPFAGYLESVSLLFGRESPNAPMWEFEGQNYHQAFKLPSGADIVIRNLEFHTDLEEFVAVYLDRILLDDDRHIDGTGHQGMLPARGEFDMSGMGGAITDYDSRPLFDLTGKEHVGIGTWCVQKVPVPSQSERPSQGAATRPATPTRRPAPPVSN